MLIFRGTLEGKKAGQYQGRSYAVLQFLDRQEDGSLKFIEINLPDGFDHSKMVAGKDIEIPVRVSAKDGKVYYRANGNGQVYPAK